MFEIRPAQPADLSAIAAVHRAAFLTDLEARLVRLLVERCQDTLSLIGLAESHVAGHVLFSPATIESGGQTVATGLGLAPVAVLPVYQNRGLGTALIRAGLERCREMGCPFVVVLGEPAYYSRFDLEPASRYGLTGEYGGGDAFQILWLKEPTSQPQGCLVRYAAEFRAILGTNAEQINNLDADEQLALWQALQQPVQLTPSQEKLGKVMRGEK